MTHRHFPYEASSEDRLTFAKWKRGTAIVYGCALLLLVAYIAIPRILIGPTTETAAADGAAKVDSHVVRTTIARRN
jgi:hypothetical protein